MEKLKWLYRKWGFPFILLCLAIAAGSLLADIRNETDRKKSEEVRESIAEVSGSGIVTNDTGAAGGGEEPQESLSSQYFLEESDSLLSEEEERELAGDGEFFTGCRKGKNWNHTAIHDSWRWGNRKASISV